MSITFGVAQQMQMGFRRPLQAQRFRWEGAWRNSIGERSAIQGTQVFWSTGDVESCQPTSPDAFALGGGEYSARLSPDGSTLCWNNGLTWVRDGAPMMAQVVMPSQPQMVMASPPPQQVQVLPNGMPAQQVEVVMPSQSQMVIASPPPQQVQVLPNGMPVMACAQQMQMRPAGFEHGFEHGRECGRREAMMMMMQQGIVPAEPMAPPLRFSQFGQRQQLSVPVQAMGPCGGSAVVMPVSGGSCRLPVGGIMPNMSGSITMPVGGASMPVGGVEVPVVMGGMPVSGGSCRLPVGGVMPNMSGSITIPAGGVGMPVGGMEVPVVIGSMPGPGPEMYMAPQMPGMQPGQMIGIQSGIQQMSVMHRPGVRRAY